MNFEMSGLYPQNSANFVSFVSGLAFAAFFLSFKNRVSHFGKLQAELARAKKHADDASLAKSFFLANISHEIRTPLGAIVGFSELLKERDTSQGERAKYIETIHRNGKMLTSLIDDILDLSKVEAQSLNLEKLKIPVLEIVTEAMQLLELSAGEKNIPLLLRVEGKIPESIFTDPARARQILINLISNAIKFTSKGSISIVLKFRQSQSVGQNSHLEFLICDTGDGICPSVVPHLFQVFSQADASATRRSGGTGLGLVLSRQLARLLGGDVVLTKSVPGAGSLFTATLCTGSLEGVSFIGLEEKNSLLEMVAESPYFTQTEIPFHGALQNLRVLVADDAPDNRLLLKTMLEAQGATVEVVNNGQEAIATALGSSFDIILMDMQMPVLDGIDATKELRKRGFLKPIVAVTAQAMRHEREECLNAGCSSHISKPVSRKHLVAAVKDCVKQ